MTSFLKTTLAATALSALPFAAFAATINLPIVDINLTTDFSDNHTVAAGDDGVIFNFNVLEDLSIPQFNLSASGTVDVDTTMYEITKPDVGPSAFGVANFGSIGVDVVPGTDYEAGDNFQVIFRETSGAPISYTLSFTTAPTISTVPVPAAGLLLLSAFGGVMVLRRRKTA